MYCISLVIMANVINNARQKHEKIVSFAMMTMQLIAETGYNVSVMYKSNFVNRYKCLHE